MVLPARFQRAAFRLGGGRSMQLSYGSTLPVKLADPLSNCPASRQTASRQTASRQKGASTGQQCTSTSTYSASTSVLQRTSASTYQHNNRPILQPTGISIDSISIDQRFIDRKPAARILQFSSFWISASRSRIFIGPELT